VQRELSRQAARPWLLRLFHLHNEDGWLLRDESSFGITCLRPQVTTLEPSEALMT
jgi:hypothetical protein